MKACFTLLLNLEWAPTGLLGIMRLEGVSPPRTKEIKTPHLWLVENSHRKIKLVTLSSVVAFVAIAPIKYKMNVKGFEPFNLTCSQTAPN
jgi:hypothetical protein